MMRDRRKSWALLALPSEKDIMLGRTWSDCWVVTQISAHARDEQDSKGDIIDEAAKDRIESGINNPNSNNEDKLYKLIFEIVLEVN
jgi:hypothetical protein